MTVFETVPVSAVGRHTHAFALVPQFEQMHDGRAAGALLNDKTFFHRRKVKGMQKDMAETSIRKRQGCKDVAVGRFYA